MSDLNKVLELLIAEDQEAAAAALSEWFTAQSAQIVESLHEGEEELDEDVHITINTDDEDELGTDVVDPIDSYAEPVDAYAEPMPSYAEPVGVVDEADDEFAFDGDADADVELPIGDEDAGEEADVDADFGGDEAGEEEAELTVDERVEDLEAELAALQAEFAELMGTEASDDAEEGDGEIADETGDEEEDEVEEAVEGFTNEQFLPEEEVDEAIAPGVPGKKTTFVQKSGIDFGGRKKVREEEDADFDDLEESYKLEPVKSEKLKTEGETTGKGEKVKVETDSPVPHKNGSDRIGGKGVEVKGKTHKGYERETAPKVAGGSEKFKNSQQEMKKISKEGDKSAELNKSKEDTKAKSPINGDPKLRGKDLERK